MINYGEKIKSATLYNHDNMWMSFDNYLEVSMSNSNQSE